ncbi:glycosyltransferase involved in cell wall biosynthesis [Paenibacillus phyllosphaerae]|uniref:Glycosyltransferase involved in cell wall biosynthesis n=1 Tax=Paenibacillus phyllosphaerae TaxID=274593 RepID=A0A7W5AUA8_9BACL|nr:GT4 family glycosyltransferase PelF [Paenibacillus phyllosphaerae]MBB3108752.1 glycosyltransferase involved in cell wall biosynthesis [Paenibacillus phyllosphaerae]
MEGKLKVMLTTEGTYPFHQGGVSTWCDILVNRLSAVEFIVYSITMNPFVTQKFRLPADSTLYAVPLWGTEEPSEHLSVPFPHTYQQKLETGDQPVREHFLPLFTAMIEELIAEVKNPYRFADILLGLYLYFERYEYKATFKNEQVWAHYKKMILKAASDKRTGLSQPDIYGLVQSLGWVYRFFNIVNTPIPPVHVAHSSAAAFCGIPCILAKKLNQTPYMLTEHGIYLREQYLSLSNRGYSTFMSKFLIRMIHSITSVNYAFADQVSPVCQYNMRWEHQFGVSKRRIDVIYNGIDTEVFKEAPPRRPGAPVMVMVARVDPIKDIKTFMEAARIVLDLQPDAKFIVYGSVSVPAYYEECVELQKQLKLGNAFIFAGHATQMAAAYQSGDIIVLSSISEAFPYSVVEAMMTGKPVVATDVGGISEALGDAGILVEPRNPQALAEGMLAYIGNPELRAEIGREGRERALGYFTLDRVLELHLKSYIKLATRAEERVLSTTAGAKETQPAREEAAPRLMQEEAIREAERHGKSGSLREAIAMYRQALAAMPDSPQAPYILTELAMLHNRLGEYDEALAELTRCEIMLALTADRRIG